MPLFIDINSLNYAVTVSRVITKGNPEIPVGCACTDLGISCTCYKNRFGDITVSAKEPIVYITHGILVNNFSIINTGRVLPFRLIFQVHNCSISDKSSKRQKVIDPVLTMHISIVNFRLLHIVVQLFCDISPPEYKNRMFVLDSLSIENDLSNPLGPVSRS